MKRRTLLLVWILTMQIFVGAVSVTGQSVIGPGKALQFDGISRHATSTNIGLSLSNRLTFEAWINPRKQDCNTIVSSGSGLFPPTDLIFDVGWNGAACGVEMKFGLCLGGWYYSSNTIPINAWTHVAVTCDGTNVQFYLNGVLDSTTPQTTAILPGSQTFYLARQGDACNCNFFEGPLDELRIWSVPRTSGEISANLHRSLTGTEPGLLAYYRFEENSGSTATNSAASGNANDFALVNGPTWTNSGALFVPAVAPSPASSITTSSATLNAVINPGNAQTAVHFEWGSTTNYGNFTTTNLVAAGNLAVSSSAALTGLTESSNYHFRVVAVNQFGTTTGSDFGFSASQVRFVFNSNDNGPGSLRQTLEDAGPGDVIRFSLPGYDQTVRLTNPAPAQACHLVLDQDVTIDGATLFLGPVQIVGNGTNSLFRVTSKTTARLTSLILSGGGNADAATTGVSIDGGAVWVESGSTLIVENSSLSTNAAFRGGAIANQGTAILINAIFTSNGVANLSGDSSLADGGAIYNTGVLQINSCTISGNRAAPGSAGVGGIANQGTLLLTNAIVAGNFAPGGTNISGAFSGVNNLIDVADPMLTPLLIPRYGSPAIDAGTDSVTNILATDWYGRSRLSGTHVDIGALEFQVGERRWYYTNGLAVTSFNDSEEYSLRAAATYSPTGSILYVEAVGILTNGPIVLNRSLNIQGVAGDYYMSQIIGNGFSRVFQVEAGTTNVLNNLAILDGNAGTNSGGGIYNLGHLTLNSCTIASNSAAAGGGIHNQGLLTLNNCTVAHNTVTNAGGGIFSAASQVTLNNCTVVSNTALAGGGIALTIGTLAFTNTIVSGNSAATNADISTSGIILSANNLINAANLKLAPLGLKPFFFSVWGNLFMPPLYGSPAINAGADIITNHLATDVRGRPRRSGEHVDIGAVEFQIADSEYGTNGLLVSAANDSEEYSLRAAITYCSTGSTIYLSTSFQPVVISNGPIVLSRNLNIEGTTTSYDGIQDYTYQMTPINGNGAARIFYMESGVTNVLSNLAILNGGAGTNSGGGIYNLGHLTLNSCTIASNSAAAGGGIYDQGSLTLNNCTVAHNSGSPGGGILSDSSQLTLNNCTVVSNTALAGGGIALTTGALALTNTIVSGNSAATNANIATSGIILGASNLVDAAELKLAPLGLKPFYFTLWGNLFMPLLYGSPAINAGTDTVTNYLAVDARGRPRRSGEHVDIGAVEFQIGAPPPYWAPDQNVTSVTSTNDAGEYSLRAAATYAGPGWTIYAGGIHPLSYGPIVLEKNLTLEGGTISGNSTFGVIRVASGTTNVLHDLTITQGDAETGAGIHNAGHLTLNRCNIISNGIAITTSGGGVANDGVLTMNDCTLAGNYALTGGAIHNGPNAPAAITLNNCTIALNNATTGGALSSFFQDSRLTLNNCTVVSNTAGNAGGIYFPAGTLALTNTILSANSASTNANLFNSGTLLAANNLVDVADPMLGPLTNHTVYIFLSGYRTTLAMSPQPDSPAVDAGTDAITSFLAADQLGLPRLNNDHVDIGAVELQLVGSLYPAVLMPPVRLGNGMTQLQFANQPGASFRIFATTNINLPSSNWTMIGFAIEAPSGSGQFQFIDSQATNYTERFYRVRSP